MNLEMNTDQTNHRSLGSGIRLNCKEKKKILDLDSLKSWCCFRLRYNFGGQAVGRAVRQPPDNQPVVKTNG